MPTAIMLLTGLPDAALQRIAAFLPRKLDRALLASALTASSSSWEKYGDRIHPTEASKIVVSCTDWDVVNTRFDLPSIGEGKLTDGDMVGMLVCIDAANTVKRLALLLRNDNITTAGFKPLWGSKVLEQIYFEQYSTTSTITCTSAISFIDTIIGQRGNSLRHVQIPYLWRRRNRQMVTDFILRYNRMMEDRNVQCSSQGCERRVDLTLCNNDTNLARFGLQECTCLLCIQHFCAECRPSNVPFVCQDCNEISCHKCRPVIHCAGCNGEFCHGECKGFTKCDICNNHYCNESQDEDECNTTKCSECKRTRCRNCGHLEIRQCMGCSKTICTDCVTELNNVQHCQSCRCGLCMDCLASKFCNGMSVRNPYMEERDDCSFCRARVFPKLLDKIRSLENEVEELKSKISP